MKAEKIEYHRSAEKGITPCHHGGAWWAYNDFVQVHPVGKRVPATVGTNGCSSCIFHKDTHWRHVECLFLKADQRFVDRQLSKRA